MKRVIMLLVFLFLIVTNAYSANGDLSVSGTVTVGQSLKFSDGSVQSTSSDAGHSFAAAFGGSGYQKLAGGLIMQWTTYTIPATVAGVVSPSVSLPMVFPHGCLTAQVTSKVSTEPGYAWENWRLVSCGTTSVSITAQNVVANNQVTVLAIGW